MENTEKKIIEKINDQIKIEKKIIDSEMIAVTILNLNKQQSNVEWIMDIGESDKKLQACKFLNYRLKHKNQ